MKNKPILIVGLLGKSTKLKSMLSEYKNPILTNPSRLYVELFVKPHNPYDVIGVEEIHSFDELHLIEQIRKLTGNKFILTSTLTKEFVNEFMPNHFEIIEIEYTAHYE